MEKKRVSLKADDMNEVIKRYEAALDGAKNEVSKLIGKMGALAENRHYELLVNLSNCLIDFYNNEQKRIMMTNFDNWIDSQDSLHALVERAHAGEEAVQTAKSCENTLRTKIDEMFSSPAVEINVTTEDAIIDEEGFEKLASYLRKTKGNLQDLKERHKKKVEMLSVTNSAAYGIIGHIEATYIALDSGIDENIKSVVNGKSEWEASWRTHIGNLDSDRSVLAGTSASAATAAMDASLPDFP